jgi:hypothetical protein
MTITGHKTRSVFDRYAIVREDDIRQATARLAEYVARQSATPIVVLIGRPRRGVAGESRTVLGQFPGQLKRWCFGSILKNMEPASGLEPGTSRLRRDGHVSLSPIVMAVMGPLGAGFTRCVSRPEPRACRRVARDGSVATLDSGPQA